MNFNQKLATLFSLIAIVCQFDVQANDAQLRNLESRVSSLEARRSPCMVNPSARPTQKCDWGGYLSIDPLLLKAQENGMEFAVRTKDSTQTSITGNFLSGNTKLKSLEFDWDWGFRLALGANLPHDGWEVYATWTWYRSHAHRSISPGTGQFLAPEFISEATGVTGFGPASFGQGLLTSGASSAWKLRYNALNLEAAREFFVSKWLVLKPHGGLTTAWIRQKDNISYLGFQADAAPRVVNAFVNMKNNFWGIGLRFGLESQWGIGCGWSVFGDASASLLYGYFKINHTENDVLSTSAVVNPLFTANSFYHVERFITDFIAGLRYDYMFCDERYHLGFQVGWEHHMFFGQNQFLKFVGRTSPGVTVANQGDLSLQGISAEVRFDF